MTETTPITIPDFTEMKEAGTPIVCLTAYSTPMAKTLDPYVDLLLVGDSLGMVLYGMETTLGVSLETMIAHGKAVMRGRSHACVIVDMPFGSYEESPKQAYRNAAQIIKETGCDGVKLEGGEDMAPTIEYLTKRNIPVMAHIGLQPQSVVKDGGYKIKGRTSEQADRLMRDAKAVEQAGAFAVVIEGTVEDVAATLTAALRIPTIGIGASSACDGQVLVTEDMTGLAVGHTPKFVKQYKELNSDIEQAAQSYASEVRARSFPSSEHVYSRPRPVVIDENGKKAG